MTMSRDDLLRIARLAAQKEGIDPDLYDRLLQNESGGEPYGPVSSAGAIGPAQLMPGTARGLGVDPYDPVANVQGGARYLRQMIDYFGGDTRKGVQAYNAGPGNIEKGILPPETEAYANRIVGTSDVAGGMGYANNPRTLLSEGSALAQPRTLSVPNTDPAEEIDTSDLESEDYLDWLQQMEDDRAAELEQLQLDRELAAEYGGTDPYDPTVQDYSSNQFDPNDPLGIYPPAPGAEGGIQHDENGHVIIPPPPPITGVTRTGLTQQEVYDRVGLTLYGQAYGGASASVQAGIRTTTGKVNELSYKMHGKPFADLPPNGKDSQDELLFQFGKTVGTEVLDPTLDRAYREAQTRARSDARHAESLKLFDERRKALWDRQDRLRREAIQRAQDKAFLAASVKQPSALRATGGGREGTGAGNISFSSLARVIPLDDLGALISSWMGGSLGLTAISPYRLSRLMATIPLANDAGTFLATLQQLWAKDGMPTLSRGGGCGGGSTRNVTVPYLPSVRRSTSRRR